MKLLYCVFACAGMVRAAELPKAETLLDRFVEVTGGRQNYEKRTTEYMSGVVEMPVAGVKGKLEMWAQAPGSLVEVIEIEGVGRIESGTDGVIAWENTAVMGPHLRSGLELRYALHDAAFNAPLRWRELYKSVQTVGSEKVDGVDCYKVVLTAAEFKPETWYIDQKTNYVVKMLRTSVTTMGEVSGEYLMKDYKDIEGILVPMTLVQRAAGQEIVLKLSGMKANVKIPKDRFAPPAEVKQLMAPPPAKKAA